MEFHPLNRQERGQLWLRLGIRVVLVAAAILFVCLAVPPLFSLLAPFVLALIVAWMFNPLVRWLHRKLTLSRKIISLVILLLIFCVIGGALYGLGRVAVTEVRSLLENWSQVVEDITEVVDSVVVWFDFLPGSFTASGEGLVARLTDWLRSLDLSGWLTSLAGRAPALVSSVSSFAISSVVFIMASYFITSDYPRLRFLITDRVPAGTRAFCGTVKRIFMKAFGGYLKSQLLLTMGVFLILTIGFLVMRQPYGLLLAAGLAVLDFIPIIGAGTVMVPWAVVDLITGNYRGAVSLLIVWGIIAVFRRVAEPKILGDQTGLSPILSLVGIYVGMRLGGVLGMILGPLLLLVFLNLAKLGIFRPTLNDVRTASRDVMYILRTGRRE